MVRGILRGKLVPATFSQAASVMLHVPVTVRVSSLPDDDVLARGYYHTFIMENPSH